MRGVGRDVQGQRRGELAQEHQHRGGLGLGGQRPQEQLDELACRHLAVAGHVPGGAQHERARQGGESGQVLDRRGEGFLVQAHLRVGEVIVVDQEQCRARPADQFGDLGEFAVDVDVDQEGLGQGAIDHVVAAQSEPMRALGGPLVGNLLGDRHVGEDPCVVRVDDGTQRGNARLLKPHVGPGLEVAARGLLELGEQVGERGVGVVVLAHVLGHAGEELVLPHPGDQLLEHRGALGVGDAVEVDLHILEVADVGHDRVGRGELVLAVGPGLLQGVEGHPVVLPLGGLHRGQGGHVLREGLIEPQVVPPLHGDEVAEPHVGQLMQHGDRATLDAGTRRLGAEDIVLQERDAARVLHGARVELGDKELVVLLEGVVHLELVLVEVEALLGLVKDDVGVQVGGQCLAAVDVCLESALARAYGALDAVVGPGDDRRHVAGDAGGGGEVPDGPVRWRELAGLDGHGRGRVGDHLPVRGGLHGELEGGLEVGLLEHREDATGVGHLELAVEVGLAVFGVHEAVQAFARVHVGAAGLDRECVVLLQAGKGDAAVGEVSGGVQGLAVESDLQHLGGDQVDEGLGTGGGGEDDGADRLEGVALFGEVQPDLVGLGGDGCGAGFCLDAREVGSWHTSILSLRSHAPCVLTRTPRFRPDEALAAVPINAAARTPSPAAFCESAENSESRAKH